MEITWTIGYQALKTLNAGASGENVAVGYKSLTVIINWYIKCSCWLSYQVKI